MEEWARPAEEAIRQRAFEISLRADGGSPEENWKRAEEELFDEQWLAAREARIPGEAELLTGPRGVDAGRPSPRERQPPGFPRRAHHTIPGRSRGTRQCRDLFL